MSGMVKSGITKEEIIDWGGPEVFNQAFAICNSGDIKQVRYDDDTLEIQGLIEQPDGWEMPVRLKLMANGRIKSFCPCIENQKFGKVCPHVVALGIAQWVTEMDLPEEPPPPPSTKKAKAKAAAKPEEAPNYIEVPMKPKIVCYLAGSRASLSIEVNVRYGKDIEFPACSMQNPFTVYIPDEDDPLIRKVRTIAAERAAMKELLKWGFNPGYQEGDLRYYIVSPQGVLDFLGAGLPELRRQGWRIELSPELEKMTDVMPSIVTVVTIKDAPGGYFDVHYTFDAMGCTVSPADVQAAINRGDGYIMRGDKVVLVDRGGIEQIRDVFNDCAPSQNGADRGWFRVHNAYASYVKSSLDLIDCDVNSSKAKFWRTMINQQNLVSRKDARYEPVKIEHQLYETLRPYQRQGVYWMRFLENSGLSGLLADEMGLGKTIQTLAWLTLQRSDPRGHDAAGKNLPALIVCPTSLVRNWEAESRKFTPQLRTLVISGAERANDFAKIAESDLIITSYALLQRDFEAAYINQNFSVVVLDEAQHIKNRQTRNARSVKGLHTIQRLVLTGTPIENSVADVWSIFDFLMPSYLGEYENFKMTFENPIADGENAEVILARLKRKISPFIMRRVKKLVAKDLPDKITKISYCPMSDEAQREYNKALMATRQMAGDMIKEKGFQKSKFELLALLMKLRQIASRAKMETFMEQLEQAIEGGHRVLVFSQFVKMLTILQKRLREKGISFCYLDGSTKDRLGQCDRFNRNRDIPVFLISLMAGGTGLNLTGADMVMHYDPWWNPAVEDQATDRAHRIGQTKTVYVMKMIAAGSVEEKVLALQRRKQAIINATVDTTDTAMMEKLTVDDFKELLS